MNNLLKDARLQLRRVAASFGLAVITAATALPSASSASMDGYTIAVGDILSFDFLDDTLPAEQLTVSAGGQITVPLLGGLRVADLTVADAADTIRKALIAQDFFIDPRFSLMIVSFRPIFVLGDVRSPGSFPFQPMMTLEQAVALAGGQSAAQSSAEDRVVAQARLNGELNQSAVKITGEATAVARLSAQLDGRTTVEEADLPPKSRDFVNPAVVSSLLPTEQRILETEQRAFETRRNQLEDAIREVTGALANLSQLAERQKRTIASAEDDLERARELYKRGIKTLTDISNLERDSGMQESRLLEIYNQMSMTRRELGELQREMADTTDSRLRKTLVEIQKHTTEIERLLVERQSTEEQMLLLGSLAAADAQKNATVAFSYLVRRTINNVATTRDATLGDLVHPGDTVLVSIVRTPAGEALRMAKTTIETLP